VQREQPSFRVVQQGPHPAAILPALAHTVERVARKAIDFFHGRRLIP
jgi:hypothetical protein